MANIRNLVETYLTMQPSGYLSSEDQGFLDRLLGRSTEAIESGVQQQQGLARTRLAQRRIGGPAAEQVLSDIGASGSLARARAAGAVANVGHSLYAANRAFRQGQVQAGFQAEVRAKELKEARRAAQRAAFGNTLASLAGIAGSFYGGRGVPSTAISAAPGADAYSVPEAEYSYP